VVVLLFWIVKVSEVDPLSRIEAAPKTLMMTGGDTTVIDALVVLPVPPSVEATWVELFFTPAVVPVMLTEKVQLALAARLVPLSMMLPLPAAAVRVPLPVSG